MSAALQLLTPALAQELIDHIFWTKRHYNGLCALQAIVTGATVVVPRETAEGSHTRTVNAAHILGSVVDLSGSRLSEPLHDAICGWLDEYMVHRGSQFKLDRLSSVHPPTFGTDRTMDPTVGASEDVQR